MHSDLSSGWRYPLFEQPGPNSLKIDLVIQKSEDHKLCGMIVIETE